MLHLMAIFVVWSANLFGELQQTDWPIFLEPPTMVVRSVAQENQPVIRVASNSSPYHYARIASHYHTIFNHDYGQHHALELAVHEPVPSFATLREKLPPYFQDSFEARSLISTWIRSDITPEQYDHSFYDTLIAQCGYHFTAEQLMQHCYAQMRSWKDYYYPGFRKFIKKFSHYEEYMLELDKELRGNPALKYKVERCEKKALEFIKNEAASIRKKRDDQKRKREQQEWQARQQTREHERLSRLHERLSQEQRHEFAKETFHEQQELITQQLSVWQENSPNRVAAYEHAVAQSGHQITKQHELSSQALDCLTQNGLAQTNYTLLHGNALQQELLCEIIDGIETFASLSPPAILQPFDGAMHSATLTTFDDARFANEMGDCLGASKLVDLGKTLLDYCAAVVTGVAEGVVDGAVGAIKGTGHLIGLARYPVHWALHPIHAAQALGRVAIKFAEFIEEYVPFYKPLFLCSNEEERAKSLRHYDLVASQCAKAKQGLVTWWQTTPTRDKLHSVTKGTTATITNIIIGNKCLELLCKTAKLAQAELALLKNTKPQTVVAGAPGEVSSSFFSISEAEKIAQAPATLLNETICSTSWIMDYGNKNNFNPEKVTKCLEILNQENISIRRFHQAIHELENMPGAKQTIKIILNPDGQPNPGNIRGFFFELDAGLQILERKETLLSLDISLGGRQFDAMTTTSLFECKNYQWQRFVDNPTLIQELKRTLGQKQSIAHAHGKKFVLHSKNMIPHALEDLKNWLQKKSIELIEG